MSRLEIKNIDEHTKQTIRELAKSEGATMSEYLIQMIERDLNNEDEEPNTDPNMTRTNLSDLRHYENSLSETLEGLPEEQAYF